IVILNFTPEVRYNYRIGVPENATYRELLNSDSTFYGGSNQGNGTNIAAEPQAWMGRPCSINLTIPPLAGLVLKPVAKE
ncbi:MAG: alpha amylase C-terminal domain-containing protein, partial [Gammaproteobacteria bacterium]|nr:alpha amylase C-terminal domain-containing protein [Gammaproteobacteria bacterium]